MTNPPPDDSYKKLFGEAAAEEPKRDFRTPAPVRAARGQQSKPIYEDPESLPSDPPASRLSKDGPKSAVSRKERYASVTQEEKDLYKDIYGSEGDIETVDPDLPSTLNSWKVEQSPLKKQNKDILQGEAQADLLLSKEAVAMLPKQAVATEKTSLAQDWRHAKRRSTWLMVQTVPKWIRYTLTLLVLFFVARYVYYMRIDFVDQFGYDQKLNVMDYFYETLYMPDFVDELQNASRQERPLIITRGRMRILYQEGLRYMNTTNRTPANYKELEIAGFNVTLCQTDYWGQELLMEMDGQELKVRSGGEDGKPRTSDDYTYSLEGFTSVAEQLRNRN